MRHPLWKSLPDWSFVRSLLVWLVLFGVCLIPAAYSQYRFDVLNTDNGLPQNSVLSILQTRDGYLWISTLDGLVRYDGARHTVFNKANSKGILGNRFMALYEDTDDTLWVGTEDGGLTRYKDGKFRTYRLEDGLPHNYVGAIRRTPEGELLVLTVGGLARLQGERFEVISTDMLSFDTGIGHRGPSGTIWYRIGTELRRVKDDRVTSYTVPAGGRGEELLDRIYEDREGRLWIGTRKPGELWMLKDDQLTRYSRRDGLPEASVTSFCEDHEGTMWFGTQGGGLVRLKEGSFTTYTTAQGLSSNTVEVIFEDREGTLWVGAPDNGITRVTRQVIAALSEKEGLNGKIIYPIIEDREGSVWVGNFGVNRFQNGKFTYYPLNLAPQYPKDRPSQALVQAFYEDRAGRLWIGHAFGLYRFQNEKFTHDDSMSNKESPCAIFQDSQGTFWFGYIEYLTRYHNGAVQNFTINDGLLGFVQPIVEDRQGRIWIGSYGGLAQYVDDRLVFLTEKDGLSSNRIRAIYEDADGVLWIGTYDGGLNRFKDGKFNSFTTKEGLFSNGVFAILEDRRGNFWMSSNQGIYRVRKQQLNDFAEGKVDKIDSISYGKADGMLNTECNGARHPSAVQTRDGRMWFPTFDGIAVVDPEAVTFNDVPPPVVIEKVILDREELDPRQPVEVRPGQDNLEIHYTGLSFIKPESMQFKYKLEGLDDDWVEAGNRRVAYFPHLAAGSYTFRVIAANADGVWNGTGATIRVTVIPPFWQTPWFLALVTLGLGLAVALAVRARFRRLERARAAQEAFSRQLLDSQEQERKRIATELHDSLGQQLLVIKNWAMIELGVAKDDGPLPEGLNEISATASQAIEEVREIIYDLRPYQLDKIGLGSTIRYMVEKVAAAAGIRFDTEIGDIDNLFSYDEQITLYRILQECVNNIVKHAQATEARVAIERDGRVINLTVEDNGRGFTPEAAGAGDFRRGGLGLNGLSERVRILGGKQSIQSSPGAGTKVIISIPVRGEI